MFVELNRSFSELPDELDENDEIAFQPNSHTGSRLLWPDITREYRVIFLAEAGAGKTEEIRHNSQLLRDDGKAAFFLRLENIPNHFEDAFEIGTYSEFEEWLSSTDEGWLFLDSIDEARLRSPVDFELAVRKMGGRIESALQRVHIVITGRPHAWRPKSDLAYCMKCLPYDLPRLQRAFEGTDDDLRQTDTTNEHTVPPVDQGSSFKVVAIDDLDKSQVERFLVTQEIGDVKAFLDDVERADAWSFTARPQDLQELASLWGDKGRIGSRLEVMEHSIARRLVERDQGRAEAFPLAPKRAREGAMLVAAAVTLTRQSLIRVPDGSAGSSGIPIAEILVDWNDRDRATLLSRPIFDESIYGAVRFHHRSVREFLTADWIAGLLARQTSRREVESLLFYHQYGLDIITPTMRPIVPWVALKDSKVLDRVQAISPEILLEEGAPNELPLETRRKVLSDTCGKIARRELNAYQTVGAAVQRFAKEDLVNDVRRLLNTYETDDDLICFLLRMIWIGELKEAKPEAKAHALSSTSSVYTRITAIRAIQLIGSSSDMEEIRTHFLNETDELPRRILAELLEDLNPSADTVDWMFNCLRKVRAPEPYQSDGLEKAVVAFVQRAPNDLLPSIVESVSVLLDTPPVMERRECNISQKFSWLMGAAADAMKRLVQSRHSLALTPICMELVWTIKVANDCLPPHDGKLGGGFDNLIQPWTELNRSSFWNDVKRAQRWFESNSNRELTDVWDVLAYKTYWEFDNDDLDYVFAQISERTAPHERRVALSLAFHLYVRGGRKRFQRDLLKRITANDPSLAKQLADYLKPKARKSLAIERTLARQNQRYDKAKKEEARKRDALRASLQSNPECLRSNGLQPGEFSDLQWYVHQQAAKKGESFDGETSGDWECLYGEFGDEVARAYRDGVIRFWRHYQPQLRSEGAPLNKTPYAAVFGLTGLAIEAGETENWALTLTEPEVELACRYASYELNGFPHWFPSLFQQYPIVVRQFLLAEICFELSTQTAEKEIYYVLDDVSSSGKWAWNSLASDILSLLKQKDPATLRSLRNMLNIVTGSTLADDEIAKVASSKCQNVTNVEQQSVWYAVWVGVDPEHAILSLEGHLDEMEDGNRRTSFAMRFITDLYGGHRVQVPRSRSQYCKPDILKRLYLLMERYIRLSEDNHRSGGYRPTIRDDAQSARDELAGMIRRRSGKESFEALIQISEFHTDKFYKALYARFARERAEQDADEKAFPWTIEQVRQFHERIERTPKNHTELAELARLRILDLKDDLEDGDSSEAKLLLSANCETVVRNYIGQRLRDGASGKYSITQEEEFADGKKPDLRFHGSGFDGPVPCELKLADKWSGTMLFERLENQLCGDYLRDIRSAHGCFILVNRSSKRWTIPNGKNVQFEGLVMALEDHWRQTLSKQFHGIDRIDIIGIDLTKRSQ